MKTELLAPAGDLARFKVAIEYGADAVYFGGKQFSLRARASNFDLEDIKEAVEYAHQRNRKAYVTVNMIPHNSDFEGLEEYLRTLESYGVDAIICASRAILQLSKRVAPKMEVHISTQQTTASSMAMDYWKQCGADRVVLARETDYDDLRMIMAEADLPVEVFIHGGMCANYSGRCTISNLLTNRDANRGGCAQSCRWNYSLYHNGQLLDREDYKLSMGSRDMNASSWISGLLDLKVSSLKIEGRMKTAFYIANVVKGYRYLIDCYQDQGYITPQQLAYGQSLLDRVANRITYPGFYPGYQTGKSQIYNLPVLLSQNYVASVIDYHDGIATVEDRNFFKKGDRLAIMNPQGQDVSFVLNHMYDLEGNEVEIANRPMQKLRFAVPVEVNGFSFIKHSEEGK